MSAPVYGKTIKRQVKNSTQWLLISDSYAITPKEHVNATWPYQFIKYMGLKHNRFCLVKKSGYGYACKGKKFISLAKELKASRNIKTIIIMGGINNDKDCSLAMIKKAMKRLDKLLRKKYPNAQILCFCIRPGKSCTGHGTKAQISKICTIFGLDIFDQCFNCFREKY